MVYTSVRAYSSNTPYPGGFCLGGYVVNMLVATIPEKLDAGVPFYGTPATESLRGKVKGPLLIHFAELDSRVNASWPDYESVLKTNNVPYEAFVYPGVNHGFHNDSTERYDEATAELAWKRTLDFFKKQLNG